MASTTKRLTKAEIRTIHQAACREIPCDPAARGQLLCPYCPHGGKQ